MKLHFQSYGQGPALLILHGLFGSLDNWVSHARKLSEHFSVYLIDQRNHGKSPHSDEWNYQLMAEDLVEFMDDQGIMQGHLLGHSMGGKTVMQVAAYHPGRIDKLIVADMAPKAYSPHHHEIIAALLSLDLPNISSRKEAEEQLAKHISDWGVRQFLLKGLGRDEQKNLQWKFNLKVLSEKYPEALKAIRLEYEFEGPTLFVSGGKSNYVQDADRADILKTFPDSRFVVLPDAGHWLHAEAPDAFLEAVLEFLL